MSRKLSFVSYLCANDSNKMKKYLLFVFCMFTTAAIAQVNDVNSRDLRGKVVYEDDEVVFRQIDEHTWIGNGHRVYNESLYLVEGNDSAVLIDAGTNIPKLDKIVAGITSKPITLILTHGHGDHVGGAKPFPEVWVAPADEQMFKGNVRRYKGEIKHLTESQIIDLGGRQLEVIYTPGHTSGSVTFFDKANHYAFSGDAFGSTNLLIFTNLSTVMETAAKVEKYIKENDIKFLFPGHYSGDNLESPKRVTDIKNLCNDLLTGKNQGIKSEGNSGGNDMMAEGDGFRLTYSSQTGIK